ncbi:MAG: preprotein translocase subunit SecE [candidate division WOR-3 bacterium]
MHFFKRVKEYLQDVISEMKKVSWVKPKELWTTTLVVIVFSTLIALFIGIWDFIFSRILTLILK